MELAALIGRLNAESRRALERAAQRCLQRTHHYVEIEHLLLELLDIEGGDFAWLLPRFGLERDSRHLVLRVRLREDQEPLHEGRLAEELRRCAAQANALYDNALSGVERPVA